MYDIVVIGGNLSGATAAITAASKGANVVLIEKNKEPYFPAHCGELIPDYTAELLHLKKIDCSFNEISKMIFNLDKKDYIYDLKKHKFILFDRNHVEKNLLKEAKKVGVDVKLGKKIKDFKPPNEIILDDNQSINGKIIIDASGIACKVGSCIGINTRLKPEDIGICIQSRVKSNFKVDTTYWSFHKPYAPFGYAWLFPFNDNMANIGLIIPGGQKIDLAKNLFQYINKMTKGNFEITSTFRACVPLAPPLHNLVKDNVMIVGDAARLAHSVSGGGIDNAIFSGALAGKIASKNINKEVSFLKEYQKAMLLTRLRLRLEYNRKSAAFGLDEKFVNNYNAVFSLANLLNKIFPSFLYRLLFEGLEKILIKVD